MTREFSPSVPSAWLERRNAAMPAHDQALTAIRQRLDAHRVPRQTRWWADLKPAERATLAKHAGLDPERVRLRWVALEPAERAAILKAAERAAAWARELLSRTE